MAQPCIQEKRISDLEHNLFGNGNPGVKQKVYTLETDIAWIKRISGLTFGMVASVMGGLIVAGIVALFRGG